MTIGLLGQSPKKRRRPGVQVVGGDGGSPKPVMYLDATVGTATTPDPGVPPTQSCFVSKHQGPAGSGNQVIAGQYENDPQRSWMAWRTGPGGPYGWTTAPTGTAAGARSDSLTPVTAISGADEEQAFTVDNSGVNTIYQRWERNTAGSWVPLGTPQTLTKIVPFDSNTIVRIGAFNGTWFFNGRIYWCEMRTGLDPNAGTVIWRFDANDYPGTGTVWTDPRGRTWTLTNASAIVTP